MRSKKILYQKFENENSFSHGNGPKPIWFILGVEPEKVKLLASLKPDALVENKGNEEFAITFIVGPKNRWNKSEAI